MKNDIIIIGGGEHSRVIVNAIVLDKFKWNYLGYLDTKNDNNDSVGCCFGTDEDISRVVEKYSNVKLIFGIGNIT